MNLNIEIKNEKLIVNNWDWRLYHIIKRIFVRNDMISDEEIINKTIESIVNKYIDYLEGRFIIFNEYEDYDLEKFEMFHQLNMELSNKEGIKKMIRGFLESNTYILYALLLEIKYGKNPKWLSNNNNNSSEDIIERVKSEEELEEIEELENLEDLEEVID